MAAAQVGWQGLLNNFLVRMASSTSLVLLLDADYPSSLEGIAADLGLARVDCVEHAAACEAAAAIDDGYRLFMAWPTTGAAPHVRQPVMVLLSKAVFPAPLWVQRNGSAEGDIAAAWRTPHCGATPYLTTKFLNWCAAGPSSLCACVSSDGFLPMLDHRHPPHLIVLHLDIWGLCSAVLPLLTIVWLPVLNLVRMIGGLPGRCCCGQVCAWHVHAAARAGLLRLLDEAGR